MYKGSVKAVDYAVSVPKLRGIQVTNPKLPYSMGKNAPKVLMVFDNLSRDERDINRMIHGTIKEFLENINRLSMKYGGQDVNKFNWATLNYNFVRAPRAAAEDDAESDENKSEDEFDADAINTKRLLKFIKQVKPNYVWTFGMSSWQALAPYFKHRYLARVSWSSQLGTPIECEIEGHTFTIFPNLPPTWVCTYSDERDAYMIGYFMRCWRNASLEKLPYAVPIKPEDIKLHMVDSMKKFDRMLGILYDKPVVSIDTETDNLNKLNNKIVIAQFAVNSKDAFILPFKHYQTPFSAKEINVISEKLGRYFMENDNDYHIYHNANFDVPVWRDNLGIPYYKADLWDIMAGEFSLDENMVGLASLTNQGYYGLGNVSIQYGFHGYVNGEFGKEDRAGIANMPLDTPGLLRYCGYDVCVPFAVSKKQQEIARDINYPQYAAAVRHLISDIINVFSTMNCNGVLVDKKYLWWLSTEGSPINQVITDVEKAILDTPEVRAAEKFIRDDMGMQSQGKGLFGAVVQTRVFNFRKKAHFQRLFFDVMKLEAPDSGADGTPSLNKAFQEQNQDVPMVQQYTQLVKAKKLRDAFVKALIKRMGENDDAKVDQRIRPNFNFVKVVTGRTSANDPNLQQIPSRGKMSKYIKRIFIARPGSLFIKVDYSAHEVRGWSLISGDLPLATAFQKGLDLYQEFLKNPTPEMKKKVKLEGDIHYINSSYFFSLPIDKVTEDIRQDVKGVTFGLIYGRSVNSLANQLKKEKKVVQDIIDRFFGRFKKASKWLEQIEKDAQKHYWVQSPLGRRRHLWPYLLPKSDKRYNGIEAACNRRARNSPIQGMGSDIGYSAARLIEKTVFERFYPYEAIPNRLPIRNQNMVHDSSEIESDYGYILDAVQIIRHCMTTGVQEKCTQLYGMEFLVDLSIDMEIGATLASVQKWDGTPSELIRVCRESIEEQQKELKYKVDVEAALKEIMNPAKAPPYFFDLMHKGFFPEASTYGFDTYVGEAKQNRRVEGKKTKSAV